MTRDRAIETAADYADALMTARRAKHLLVLLLLLMLLVQLALFFVARYTTVLDPLLPPATAPAVLATGPGTFVSATMPVEDRAAHKVLQYATGWINFLGILLAIVLCVVLFLIAHVMLVGRLVGVARVVAAFLWSVLLVVFLFPWQAFLNNQYFTADWKLPGVLYTWDELVAFAKFQTGNVNYAIIKWTRFVGFPLVAILILLTIQIKSSRGLRQALGEESVTGGAEQI